MSSNLHVSSSGHCPREVTAAVILCPSVSLTVVNLASRPLITALSSCNSEAPKGLLWHQLFVG